MVAVRTEASQCCYTVVNQALGSGDVGAGGPVAPLPRGSWVMVAPESLKPPDGRSSVFDRAIV
jgi:hypothetical protein